jgi:hypothetical protein
MSKIYVCKNCGYYGQSERGMKGAFLIEVVLWLFFIVPGIIYSVWRLTTKYNACPKCKGDTLIPSDTPMGQRLLNEMQRGY